MNTPLRFAVLAITLACAVLSTTAHARTASYPHEAACVAPPETSSIYASHHEQIADTSRGPLAYYRFGHGSPLLLVTGYRATMSEWDATFLAELAKHHDVIVFDNRGIGRSMPNAASFTIDDMASDTAALIDTLALKHATVVGWSMGGSIVQQLAIDKPQAIGKMVLMSALAPGRTGTPVPADVMAKLAGGPGVTFNDVMAVLFPASSVKDAERCFAKDMFKPSGYPSPAISGVVTDGQTVALEAWETDDKAPDALRSVRIDTLVLSGDDDAVVVKENAAALTRLLPHAHLLLVKQAGHAMMYQYPVALARAIGSFARH
ncbi:MULTISPECIES: alpha/beta fold hydrolase [Paraburkholderia]|uniref:alpha/beta fold hydrolase n=1 Tax=Paraburkholderia TaxID=1822464 RepID=UPI002256E387|nr:MULTISPECIES: alpha/beta hydrolase [Paraburkholderia]MCX4140709.1 alpha/beta hydrolase [Paraburkholderia aspalathi]MDN7173393.1 alpha/beta hydrolase [Paraburkholderia sp. SEWSISQ10-3 4]MDQ6503034.1 alpha/beta hydrolase [Paraburkholderia aspalathi]